MKFGLMSARRLCTLTGGGSGKHEVESRLSHLAQILLADESADGRFSVVTFAGRATSLCLLPSQQCHTPRDLGYIALDE